MDEPCAAARDAEGIPVNSLGQRPRNQGIPSMYPAPTGRRWAVHPKQCPADVLRGQTWVFGRTSMQAATPSEWRRCGMSFHLGLRPRLLNGGCPKSQRQSTAPLRSRLCYGPTFGLLGQPPRGGER